MKKFLTFSFLLFVANTALAGDQATYEQWLAGFKQQATRQGVSQQTIATAFADSKFLPRVIELDRKQPESKMTFPEYKAKIVSAQRINQGRHELRKHRVLLEEIGKTYGVQPQYIVALWGIETNFGSNTGGFSVIDSLATLAFEGRRSAFFTDELINALKIIDQGHIAAVNMKGSWAGAMGQSQFMPSSFLAYAQDYNRDGRKDIWNTHADVFASAANYLARSGWKGDEKWGRAVKIPANLTDSMIGRDKKRSIAEWARIGVTLPNGHPLPQADMKGAIVVPDGVGSGEAFLVYGNYDTIMKWNRSTYFATSVGLLADAIAAGQ